MADRTMFEDALRTALAEALYAGGARPDWLTTVDGSPNSASYELADRALGLLTSGIGLELLKDHFTSRHQHAAEAILAALPDDYDAAGEEDSYRQSDLMVKRAQVHATLATLAPQG